MNAITWVILIGIVVGALARRAGGVTRGVQALQRQAAAAQAATQDAVLAAARPSAAPLPPPLSTAPPRRPSAAATRPAPALAQPRSAPEASMRATLRAAFSDPAHARTAVILSEILAPPVGLR